MKRIIRNPEKFGVIELFSVIGRKQHFMLGDKASEEQFLQGISASFRQNKENPIIIHGRRIESMFGYVAASLGKCVAIKQEDGGELYVLDTNLQPPDYRIIMGDGYEFFVEVKNCHKREPSSRYSFKESYIQGLSKYARVFNRDLKIALYWSRRNIWTLFSIEKIPTSNGRHSISMPESFKINEMSMLGDMMVGTTPPLVFRVITDSNKPRSVDKTGRVGFAIGGIELYCADTRIEHNVEQNLAFYFMLYGDWCESELEAKIENGELLFFDLNFSPFEPTHEQKFEIIGRLSGMISRSYNDLTTSEKGVEQLIPLEEPGSLGVVIPPDYKGRHLPLWQFTQKPSYES